MSKTTDAATFAALTKLAADTQSKTDEALEVWRGCRERRWAARKSEDSALVQFRRLERRSKAAAEVVKTYEIATDNEGASNV
jgi:hypothetical protein